MHVLMNLCFCSNIYRKSPEFKLGHGMVLGYMIVCLLGGSIALRIMLARENKLRAAGKRDGWVEGLGAKEQERLGDERPDFMYTL